MAILFGTSDGVWTLKDGQPHQMGLAGKKVCHVATRDDTTLAAAPYDGLYVDVHTVRPDPSQPDRLVAVTGRGFYVSDDGGHAWEQRMDGMSHRYTVGLHVNPKRAGELLVTAGEGPPGVNGYLYHSRDAGRHWKAVENDTLPDAYSMTPVVLFTDDAAWVATHAGQIFQARAVAAKWSLVGELPATIYAAAAEGCSSSADSGFRRQ